MKDTAPICRLEKAEEVLYKAWDNGILLIFFHEHSRANQSRILLTDREWDQFWNGEAKYLAYIYDHGTYFKGFWINKLHQKYLEEYTYGMGKKRKRKWMIDLKHCEPTLDQLKALLRDAE